MKKISILMALMFILVACQKVKSIATIEQAYPPFTVYTLDEEETKRVEEYLDNFDATLYELAPEGIDGCGLYINLTRGDKSEGITYLGEYIGIGGAQYIIEDIPLKDIFDKYFDD